MTELSDMIDAQAKRDALQHRQIELISHLDRCQHGRHAKDVCYGCQGEGHETNAGNPYLDTVIGYVLHGNQAITVRDLVDGVAPHQIGRRPR